MLKNKDWLDLTIEKTIEPNLRICDPHHHLWVNQPHRISPRYLIHDCMEDITSGHNVVSTVFIECGDMYKASGESKLRVIGETEFANGIAAMSASGAFGNCQLVAGIVGMADLCLGANVVEVLEAHIIAGGGRFRGVRHGVAWNEDKRIPVIRTNPGPKLLMDKKFREGFSYLKRFGLSFECWCYHPQLPELCELADIFSETLIILNHFGIPLGIGAYRGKEDEVFSEWKSNIKKLSNYDNVNIKLGGLNMAENGLGWDNRTCPPTSEELMLTSRRYFETAIDYFGPERCMFESNFPVDKISCSYNVLWNSFKRLAKDLSDSEKSKLFHDTAAKIYRL